MKSYFTTFLLILSFGLLAQTQDIPNGDFEDWSIRDHYKPDGWYAYLRNSLRTTDAKVGNYALKLVNTYKEGTRGTRSYVRNIDYNNLDEIDGFAFDGDPLSLVFWSKHDLAEHDTARINVRFNYQGSYKGSVDFRFTGSTDGQWVKYNVPIQWSGSRTPDSVYLYLYSYADYGVDGDGFVIFDDVHFEKIGERMEDFTNFDFEDWTNYGVEYPDGWRSIDLLVYDSYYSFLLTQSNYLVEGDEAFQGGRSLMIKNYDNYGSPRTGYCFYGTENNQSYRPAFAVNDTFKYLQGYYKYLPDGEESEDTARVLFRAWENGSSRSYDVMDLPRSEEWKFFKLPINYYNSTIMPDSGTLVFWSTVTDSIHGYNSSLYVDALQLVMEPQPATIKDFDNQLHVYPNPATDQVYIEAQQPGSVVVINQLGQEVLKTSLNVGTNTINISGLQPSLYHFIIKNKSDLWTIKILKQ